MSRKFVQSGFYGSVKNTCIQTERLEFDINFDELNLVIASCLIKTRTPITTTCEMYLNFEYMTLVLEYK